MRLCSYTVVYDCGFAPNPFADYCTLAACTPNHQGIHLDPGDWIVGHATADRGQGLVYAMEVSEVLDFDAYYNDLRFEQKKPRFDRTWREACGDNIYHRGVGGVWKQDRSLFHDCPEDIAKDTRHPVVLVSERFHYFGANAPTIPERFASLIRDRHGCKCAYPPDLAQAFVAWLRANFAQGVLGEPRDLEWVQRLTNRCSRRRSRSGVLRRAGSVDGRRC